MQEKVKGMLKGMSMPKKKSAPSMPKEMMEEEGMEEEEMPETELSLEEMGGEEEGAMPQEPSVLADISDDELKAELEKRGMKVVSGGAGETPLPPISEEEDVEEIS